MAKNSKATEVSRDSILSMMLLFSLVITSFMVKAQNQMMSEKYRALPFGCIKPSGWLKIQMMKDMAGFVGNLDQLVPELMNDPIYGAGRLKKLSRTKDLGNLKSGDAGGDEQYKWWNSETQSNWWDGYIRNAFLLDDQRAIEKVKNYIDGILATQDEDGYLGIYDRELRYNFTGENGELWSKTTLYRGLLAFYECTHDDKVWNSLIRAVNNVMVNYPVNKSQPFFAGKDFSGGVAHGLTFTDVLDRIFHLTGDRKYIDYAAFLYRNFSENYSSETDAQLPSILNPDYKLKTHGAHTYEHLRPLIVATYSSVSQKYKKALQIYLERINRCTTPTGGAIGDEWIGGRQEDATHTGYEYCSLHELMESYAVLFQKSGELRALEEIETIFYNAAQGSRNPDHSSIAYLKTDNSYEMLGSKNGEVEPDRKQTRYKYSPAHQDVAVCCAPNAGRISPYFLQSCWFKEGDNALIASVLSPNVLETTIQNVPIRIEEITEYPYQNRFVFRVETQKPVSFCLKVRKPVWAKSIKASEKYNLQNGFLEFDRSCSKNDRIEIEFDTDATVKEDLNHEKYFSYGALIYARPIAATELKGKTYAPGFEDLTYFPMDSSRYEFIRNHQAIYRDGKITVHLRNKATQKTEKLELIPLAKSILRQASFR